MLLLTVLLLFSAVLNQSLGQEEEENEEDEEDLTKGSGVALELQQEIVDRHNEIRRNVEPTASNMLKMIWNETIGVSSRKWADQCQPASSPMEDRTFDGVLCGQSIFQSNQVVSWLEVINYWYGQRHVFKYGVGALDPLKSIYGYTQAVWYRSYQIGCAVSYCLLNEYSFHYVCQYCPTGNIAHQVATPYKEGPSCGDCPKNCEDKLCTNPCPYMDQAGHCDQLKKFVGCKTANKNGHCKATCRCKNKIK
ncbi:serotriflin-like [Eublepharis macularius]|uniref:Serotriflin-like n=1 Tax=Eublepharis macularius TaxID=481883 RepID=A0AA97IW11_EUBMA|nr:serotriflin-like [Eublepharis macularius]